MKRIETLKDNQIFVFGSNANGNHAGGAARQAVESFGAVMGQAKGLQGQSYAIVTLDGNMKRVKITTSNAELEEFLARTDIEIINVDVRSCEQSWFAQEYFTAVIYYDDEPKSEYNPDYWTRLEHTYAGMAMQQLVSIVNAGYDYVHEETAIIAYNFAHALVEKMKGKEK